MGYARLMDDGRRVLLSSSSASVAGILCTPNDRRRVSRVFGSV